VVRKKEKKKKRKEEKKLFSVTGAELQALVVHRVFSATGGEIPAHHLPQRLHPR